MEEKEQSERAWIQESLRSLQQLGDPQFEFVGDADSEWPDWVYNLLLRLLSIPIPGVKVKNIKDWASKDLGRFLGRYYALVRLFNGEIPLSPSVAESVENNLSRLVEHTMTNQPEVNFDGMVDANLEEFERWLPRLTEHIDRILCSALRRPHGESTAFFSTFGRALDIDPRKLLVEQTLTVNDKIALALVRVHPVVERLESVAELHRQLDQALRPRGITVTLKQIEKFCQRIELHFRDGPGRPKGSKNSDKSPRSLGVISQE